MKNCCGNWRSRITGFAHPSTLTAVRKGTEEEVITKIGVREFQDANPHWA